MSDTPPKASPDGKYLYGSDEEKSNRATHNGPATESHFSQIRPATSGASAADAKGSVKNNRASIK